MRRIIRFLIKLMTLPFYVVDDFIKFDIVPSKKALKDYLLRK